MKLNFWNWRLRIFLCMYDLTVALWLFDCRVWGEQGRNKGAPHLVWWQSMSLIIYGFYLVIRKTVKWCNAL